ncbi:MAG TPA: hypothetical protein VFR02_00130 [bacterium]|nr:hypothetical protein [bacterium]
MRRFCVDHGLDPSNWSKVERGVHPAPKDERTLREWAKYFGLKPHSEGWDRFMDEARISRGEIPKDILKDEEVLSLLPAFFRTVRGVGIGGPEAERLIEKIREANRPGNPTPRLQKTVKKIRLGKAADRDDVEYWLSRPAAERIEAVELLRKERYGSSARLQGTFRVIEPA